MSKQKREYFVKTPDDGYLVSGSLNGIDFDGKGKPFFFTKSEAKDIADVTGGLMEKQVLPKPCDDCHIKKHCPLSGKISNGGYCSNHKKE